MELTRIIADFIIETKQADIPQSVYEHAKIALLALAEYNKKNGIDFLTAYIIGFKAGVVIGECAGMDHYMHGWHATSTIGHFAAV
ncbi:MmgE/PrpD family protein [Desulfobacula sp.]|uniref:MmgE/PrpD family protein n=1 Tax=Desulfobacula sp. TaxID=2593537 RepID=UPI002615221C|nr:MmgE/PrpD family protein [Desulfobacula sp.]